LEAALRHVLATVKWHHPGIVLRSIERIGEAWFGGVPSFWWVARMPAYGRWILSTRASRRGVGASPRSLSSNVR